MLQNKHGYFQGTEEPTPKKKKYKSEKAITVQPRFKEPLYRNYDLYETEGVDGMAKHGPGTGLYQNMNKYKSVKDFIDKKRKRNEDLYKADDSYIEDIEVDKKERISKMKTRANLLNRIIKNADYMLPSKEHNTDIYDWKNSPYQGIPKAPKRHDSNNIDFPVDEYIDPELATGTSDTSAGNANQMGGYLDKYLPMDDFENKPPTALDFGRDYVDDVEESKELDLEALEALMDKYTTEQKGLYGMPDGVNLPDEDLGDPTNINPYYGTIDSENTLYDKLWI